MTTESATLPVTRREFHLEFMIVWLFIVIMSASLVDVTSRWTSVLVPIFGLVMVLLHGRALQRAVQA